jgi:hypothetical protein
MQTDCSPHATPRRRVRRPALFAFAVLAPLMTSGLLRAQLPNPAGYLTFDEGKGTVAHDSSGRNENATLFGAAGWTTGLVGPSALNLPGFSASYAEIPGDVLDTTKSYSVAAWVKLNTVGTNFQTFVSEDGDGQSALFSAVARRHRPILLHHPLRLFYLTPVWIYAAGRCLVPLGRCLRCRRPDGLALR